MSDTEQEPDSGNPVVEISRTGRPYIKHPEGNAFGIIWLKDGETVEQAITRAQERKRTSGTDKPPRSRTKRSKSEQAARPPSRNQTTKRIYEMVYPVTSGVPTTVCVGLGDQWGAKHFSTHGQRFAVQVAQTSEQIPALRAWLEEGLEGGQRAVEIVAGVSLAMGALALILPPVVYYLHAPAPNAFKAAFKIPIEGGPAEVELPPQFNGATAPPPPPPPVPDTEPVMTDLMRDIMSAPNAPDPEHPGVSQPVEPGADPAEGVD